MKVSVECTYCGNTTIETIYDHSSLKGKICRHGNCRNKQFKVRDITNVDYYKGCPPFPPMGEKQAADRFDKLLRSGWIG